MLYRPDTGAQLYGSDDENYVALGNIPIELVATPAEELRNSVDATACVLPDEVIRPQDRLKVNGETYRVQTVAEECLFGIVTHLVLKLVKLHGHKHEYQEVRRLAGS